MNKTAQRGFSLVEMMVGLATSMFLLAGVMGMFSTTLSTQGSNLKQTRLNQELRNIMDLMTRDIRRAGYWSLASYTSQPQGAITLTGGGPYTVTATTPAFTNLSNAVLVGRYLVTPNGVGKITARVSNSAVTVDVYRTFSQTWFNEGYWMISDLFAEPAADPTNQPGVVTDIAIPSGGQCIQYTYDRNGDGTLDTDDKFAFRLNNGVLQMHMYDPSSTTVPNCYTNAGAWTDLSSDAITITNLTFSNSNTKCINLADGSTCASPTSGQVLLYQRQVDITLTGALASNSSVTRTLTESVRVRNDVIRVQ